MKPDIQQIEHLNYLFFQVISHIFLSPKSTDEFSDMTMAQKRVLYSLSVYGPQRMSELARLIAVTTAAATSVIDKLVRAGLVERTQDESDRRVVGVQLTELGRETVKLMNKTHEERLESVLQELDLPKQHELITSFERIHTILNEISNARTHRVEKGA